MYTSEVHYGPSWMKVLDSSANAHVFKTDDVLDIVGIRGGGSKIIFKVQIGGSPYTFICTSSAEDLWGLLMESQQKKMKEFE